MKTPHLELMKPLLGNSFSVKHYLVNDSNNRATFWHFHPELEIVYVKGGSGVRHVGNHMSYYEDGDLVLIGSNLPHNGFTNKFTGNSEEVVIHFDKNFAGKGFWNIPEMSSIKKLIHLSSNGLSFHGESKNRIGNMIKSLSSMNEIERLLKFIGILESMAKSNDIEILNTEAYSSKFNNKKTEKASKVFQYIRDHYADPINLKEIAAISSMTVPSFCRYFKNMSDKTFTQFLNDYRIIKSCKLLRESEHTIRDIALMVGYNSIAHFNKHFKLLTRKTPKEYRSEFNIIG